MSLVYYAREQKALPDLYERDLTEKQKAVVFNKLRRHFKLHVTLHTKYRRPTQSGRFHTGGNWALPYITLGRKSNLGVLVHEIAHAFEYQKHLKTKHRLRLWKIQQRIAHYVQTKGYWGLPINHAHPSVTVNLDSTEAVMNAVLPTEAPVCIAGRGFKPERPQEKVKHDV